MTSLSSLIIRLIPIFLFTCSLSALSATSHTTEKGFIAGRPYVVIQDQGLRKHMEDTYIVASASVGRGDGSLCKIYGVFDGHGGDAVAQWLPHQISLLFDIFDFNYFSEPDGEHSFGLPEGETLTPTLILEIKKTIRGYYRYLDRRIYEEKQAFGDAGSTAIVVIELQGYCFCVNLGDSRSAAFALEDPALSLVWVSEDHKPNEPEEKGRIEQLGGFVKKGRVNGRLALSRAFGDIYAKQYPQPTLGYDHIVSPMPDIQVFKKQPMIVVLASDGLWDMFTVEEIQGILKKEGVHAKSTQEELESIAVLLLMQAQQRCDEKTYDNITIMLTLV